MHHYWLSQYIKAIVPHQREFEFELSQSENFILFSPVLFHLPSWIIVQSDDCFSIHHLEFLSNHRLSCHLELLSNQKTAFHPPSCIFDQSEMSCPLHPCALPLAKNSHFYTTIIISSNNWNNIGVFYIKLSLTHVKTLLCICLHWLC